jgi:hypothetical protein
MLPKNDKRLEAEIARLDACVAALKPALQQLSDLAHDVAKLESSDADEILFASIYAVRVSSSSPTSPRRSPASTSPRPTRTRRTERDRR